MILLRAACSEIRGKRVSMSSGKIDDQVLEDFLQRIDPVRQEIKQIVLFGSRARGDYAFDSDYDLLLVVVNKNDRLIDVLIMKG